MHSLTHTHTYTHTVTATPRDGGLLVTDRRLVVNTASHMQELLLHTDAPTNAAEFRHPLTLLRLAHFVRDATKARLGTMKASHSSPMLPLVCRNTHMTHSYNTHMHARFCSHCSLRVVRRGSRP